MYFNPYTITPIICCVLAIVSGIFVLLNNPKAKLNIIFFFICINICGWFSFYIPYNFTNNENFLLVSSRIAFCFISFLPIMCFTFVTTYLNAPKNKLWFIINTAIGIIFSILSITTDTIIHHISYYPWHPYPAAGKFHFLLILHCAYLAFIMLNMLRKAIHAATPHPKKRNLLKYIFTSICILAIGVWDFLANYNIPVFPIGEYTSTAFLLIVSYAIVKHQLMDINIVVKKGLLYSFLISTITLIYLIIVFIIERLFNNYIGHHNFATSLITAIIIAIFFIPLKNQIQNFLEKLFFRGTQSEILKENELLRKEVQQTDRLKSVAILASGIAHEIKNPLTALKTFAEFLQNKKDDVEFINKFTPIVTNEVNRIDHLVHELLEFAKPSPVQLTQTNIHSLIDSTIDILGNNLFKHHIHVNKIYTADISLLLNIDQNQIKQALLNILLNAIDAMPDSGKITISTKTLNNNEVFEIRIQDTGIGIEQVDLPHIFDPFFSKKSKGTGLGLSVTHEIIKNHQGKIFVESKKNMGTTFKIELPYELL